MVLGGGEGSVCEILIGGTQMKHVSEFKYLRYVLDESSTDGAECYRKVASGRKVTGSFRSLVNGRCSQLECESYCMRQSLCL